jgi:hypothetical protein
LNEQEGMEGNLNIDAIIFGDGWYSQKMKLAARYAERLVS